jgi:hypothetical protein
MDSHCSRASETCALQHSSETPFLLVVPPRTDAVSVVLETDPAAMIEQSIYHNIS